MDLRLRVRTEEDATVVEVGGEADLHGAPALRAELERVTAGAAPRVVVDLSEVSFLDSTGVGILVGALKAARRNGGALHFCGAQSRVRRILEITGLIGLLPLFETRAAALAALELHLDEASHPASGAPARGAAIP